MGRTSRGGWTVLAGALLAATVVAATPAAASSSKSKGHSAPPKLVQLGHATFWECSTKTTVLLVAVNTLTLHPGVTLKLTFTVRNTGATSCNYTAPYASVAPGPTTTALQAGPCGSVGFEILGRHRTNVWPGAQVVNCPALGFAQLAANGTVSGTGTWDQTRPNSKARVPAGNYTLVVDNKQFSFPLRVVTH
jgi:hypothetical protein